MSLPFVSVGDVDRSSVVADALPALYLLAPIFLITLIPDHSRPVPTPLGWLSLVLGVAAFPYSVVKYIDASTVAETLGGSVGLGARLLVFGTFVTLIGIAVGLARNLLRLPNRGTYPAREPEPAAKAPAPAAPARRPATEAAQERSSAPRADRTPRPRPSPQQGAPQQQASGPEQRPAAPPGGATPQRPARPDGE
jgi:hypothetical protein